MLTIDSLAQEIRRVDGNHSLGAGALAEALMPFLSALSDKQAGEVKALEWIYREQPVRTYCASDDRGDLYWINQSFGSDSYYFTTVRRSDGSTLYDSDDLEAARAAAQADYEQRTRSALVDVPAVEPVDQRLYDGTQPMADGGDTPMTAAEEVLAWLLVEKIGVPDDVAYSPDQAQEIIVRQLSSPPLSREGEDSAEVERLTRPIFGIEHRTAQEVFDIMADRIRLAATRSGSATTQTGTATASRSALSGEESE